MPVAAYYDVIYRDINQQTVSTCFIGAAYYSRKYDEQDFSILTYIVDAFYWIQTEAWVGVIWWQTRSSESAIKFCRSQQSMPSPPHVCQPLFKSHPLFGLNVHNIAQIVVEVEFIIFVSNSFMDLSL